MFDFTNDGIIWRCIRSERAFTHTKMPYALLAWALMSRIRPLLQAAVDRRLEGVTAFVAGFGYTPSPDNLNRDESIMPGTCSKPSASSDAAKGSDNDDDGDDDDDDDDDDEGGGSGGDDDTGKSGKMSDNLVGTGPDALSLLWLQKQGLDTWLE